MSPPAANLAASASSAALCFHAKLSAKLAFVPYPWASSKHTETEKMDGRPDVCMYFSSRSALEAEPKGCQALKNRFDCLSSVDGSEVASFGGIKIKGARGLGLKIIWQIMGMSSGYDTLRYGDLMGT